MNNISEFFSFNVRERFLHFLVLLRGVIRLHTNNVVVLRQVFIVSYSYQTYFSFLGSNLNFDCGCHGLRRDVVRRRRRLLSCLLMRCVCVLGRI
jgi:hypothetical protein